jgi:carboxymethylenebutenolidase
MADDSNPLPFEKTKDTLVSRRGFGVLSIAASAALAGAAGAETPVTETDVTIKTADGVCDAALFYPAGKGTWPATVVFADAMGLRPAFRDIGKRLAAQGYVVLVPNPYYRVKKSPVFAGPVDFAKPDDRAQVMALMGGLTPEFKARDVAAYLAYLDKSPRVNKKAKVGVSGYCMGGLYVMLAASSAPTRVGAGASFHGGGLVTDQPTSPHLALVPKIKGELLIAVAANDDEKQPDAKDKLKEACAAASVPAKIEVYTGCNHGWCVSDGAAYNRDGAEKAWGELTALYKRALV